MTVLAEGIETPTQLLRLCQIGCELGQVISSRQQYRQTRRRPWLAVCWEAEDRPCAVSFGSPTFTHDQSLDAHDRNY